MTGGAERLRWWAALAGPLLFLASSLMPWFGGAKRRARCVGREFTGEWDDCFTDGLPIVEMLAPIIALALCWMFARFAFAMWSPPPGARVLRWRLAASVPTEEHWPVLHVVAAIGMAWALWRGTTYLIAPELWPFVAFWISFAAWFAAGFAMAWPRLTLA